MSPRKTVTARRASVTEACGLWRDNNAPPLVLPCSLGRSVLAADGRRKHAVGCRPKGRAECFTCIASIAAYPAACRQCCSEVRRSRSCSRMPRHPGGGVAVRDRAPRSLLRLLRRSAREPHLRSGLSRRPFYRADRRLGLASLESRDHGVHGRNARHRPEDQQAGRGHLPRIGLRIGVATMMRLAAPAQTPHPHSASSRGRTT